MRDDKNRIRLLLVVSVLMSLAIIAAGCSGSVQSLEYVPTPEPPPLQTPASFSVTNMVVTPLVSRPDEAITITAEIRNSGDTADSYLAVLKLNGIPKAQKPVYIPARSKSYVSWQVKGGQGKYIASVGGLSTNYTVQLPEDTREYWVDEAGNRVVDAPPVWYTPSQPSYYDYDTLREQQEYRAWETQEEFNRMQIEELKRQEAERRQQEEARRQRELEEEMRKQIMDMLGL